ncbi:MAG: chemotaxis protein CheW [Lachnospiraceae bacterium]|nr:chemotaxis protein CheW [Lachnospiraceae bacterium]
MTTKQVIFKLGTEEYGMDISLVSGIENYTKVVPIPNAPAHIIGILNLRGDVIPVYSLRKKFRMEEITMTAATQLLVTNCKGVLIGYKVDSVVEILEMDESQIRKIPPIVKCDETSYAKGVVESKGQLVVLLDIENILSEQEREAVKEFSEATNHSDEQKG